MKRFKIFLIVLVLALVLTACTGSAEKDLEIVEEIVGEEEAPDTPVPPTNTPVPPTPTEEPIMLPVSMVSAPVGEGEFNQYKLQLPGYTALDFEESELPALPGTVTANWFTSGGFYVVAFYGLDLEASGPLCPGSSILTANGWEYISNAPTKEGACEGFTTLTDDPAVGPIDCHGTLFYRTAIPSDLQGTLFGTLEMLDAEGNMLGITSQAESTPDMFEIDLEATCQ